jgi:hypothetical protein
MAQRLIRSLDNWLNRPLSEPANPTPAFASLRNCHACEEPQAHKQFVLMALFAKLHPLRLLKIEMRNFRFCFFSYLQ